MRGPRGLDAESFSGFFDTSEQLQRSNSDGRPAQLSLDSFHVRNADSDPSNRRTENDAQWAAKKEDMQMDNESKDQKDLTTTAIERLRASKQAADQGDLVFGHADGKWWAAHRAEYEWLWRLAGTFDANEGPWDTLRNAVDPRGELSHSEFYETCFADELKHEPSETYVTAFISGAVELFNHIRSEI